MLSTDVKTTSELMSIALQAEHEAVRRYKHLATAMREAGNAEAASLFERMVEEESGHENLIEEWARLEGVELRDDIGPVVWQDPQVSTQYDGEAIDPLHSTPYRALAFAVHNEERAFRFYTHVAATAEDPSVREYAEILAQEELGHAALLRAMRRRAWHAEQNRESEVPDIDPGAVRTLADLLTIARSAEHCLAENLAALGETHPELTSAEQAMRDVLAQIEADMAQTGEPGEKARKAIQAIEDYRQRNSVAPHDAEALLERLSTDSDRCFAFYDAVVSQAKDEQVMLAAQKLSESILDRISLLQASALRPAD